MGSPVIQVRFKGRVVQTVSFQGDTLRIGRMKENDIVINNLSVSRFHAVLKRENGQVLLEDCGSENGCSIDGTRIEGSVVLQPGDEVLIGKHRLVLSESDGDETGASSPETHGKSDAWDASATYFVGTESQAKMPEEPAASSAKVTNLDEEDLFPAPPSESDAETGPPNDHAPVGSQVPDEGEPAQVAADAQEPVETPSQGPDYPTPGALDSEEKPLSDAEAESSPVLGESGGEQPFAFDMDEDLAGSDPDDDAIIDPRDYDVDPVEEEPVPVEAAGESAVEDTKPASNEMQAAEEQPWYAGLIIQNRGKLDRIISWDEDRLTAGRAPECEIFLDQPEISRRHVVFVREGGHYEVRDLESINGILVNGEKVQRRRLEVGDVVAVECYELTFLLDRQPIGSEIKTDARTAVASSAVESRFNMTMIDENLPPGSALRDPAPLPRDPARAEEASSEPLEESLFDVDDDREKDLVDAEVLAEAPLELEDPMRPVVDGDVLTLELKIRVADLPEPLRAALADVDGRDLKLPVAITLKLDS
jgi:pSer/pThr/pTyr-binding forkhead associated (FHA) protein